MNSTAATIGLISALIVAVTGLITAVTGFVKVLRPGRPSAIGVPTPAKVATIAGDDEKDGD